MKSKIINFAFLSDVSYKLFLISLGGITLFLIVLIKSKTAVEFENAPLVFIYSIFVTVFIFSRLFSSLFYKYSLSRMINSENCRGGGHYEPLVSFIVPCKNEEEAITKTIDKCFEVDYPKNKFEVIVINDGSTDGTINVLEALKKKHPNLIIVDWKVNKGKRYAMAEGFRKAKGEIIIQLDSDSYIEPDTFRNLIKPFQNPEIGAVCAHADPENADENWLTKMQAAYYFISFRILKAAESTFMSVFCCSGCSSAYRKNAVMPILNEWLNEAFLGLPVTYGDDRALTSWLLKNDWKTIYTDETQAYTIVPEKIKQLLKQQLRWKKSWIINFFKTIKFLYKKQPFLALTYFIPLFLISILAPFMIFKALIYSPIIYGILPIYYIIGIFIVTSLIAIYYRLLSRTNKYWPYLFLWSIFNTMILAYVIVYAAVRIQDRGWGTRQGVNNIVKNNNLLSLTMSFFRLAIDWFSVFIVFVLVFLTSILFFLIINTYWFGNRNIFLFNTEINVIYFITLIIYIFFICGALIHFRDIILLKKYFNKIQRFKLKLPTLENLIASSKILNKKLPKIGIFVPARNEGYVIENTINRLAKLDYPKDKYCIFIIVDERELDDNVEIFTKNVVEKVRQRLSPAYGTKFVGCIEVPKWYSGNFKNFSHTFEKSTKGRALNYALQTISGRSGTADIEMIGVLDADGRLDIDVLKEVALNRIKKNSQILQGPVFQISNFSQIKIVGVSAGLELAIYHMTRLPSRFHKNKMQFLAGTNYFIEKKLISAVGGWNNKVLVEDAELALRIYKQTGIKAQWLNCPELEQSPENFKIYNKQRERWARGHFYLINDIVKSSLCIYDKIIFIFEIIISQLRFLIDIFIFLIAIIFIVSGNFTPTGDIFKIISFFLIFVSLLIFDTYGHMYRKMAFYMNDDTLTNKKILQSIKLFLYFPIFMFIQAFPRFLALKNYLLKLHIEWYKTERTKELITE